MSNRREAVFATQAVISIGAIWTAALPMLGVQDLDRVFSKDLVISDDLLIHFSPSRPPMHPIRTPTRKTVALGNESRSSGKIPTIDSKVFLSEDGFRLGGRDVDMLQKLAEIVEAKFIDKGARNIVPRSRDKDDTLARHTLEISTCQHEDLNFKNLTHNKRSIR
ncbi:hypothetical protein TNCV_729761 [Trichonephila clavipes]|nr:hypothetical protein TNCV_729761 [Trichonephila clavipes]